MPTDEITIDVDDGDPIVLSVTGELSLVTAPALRAALLERVQGDRDVVVDLARVTFIDSTSLGVLIGAAKRLHEQQRRLRVRSPGPQASRVLATTGATKLLEVEP